MNILHKLLITIGVGASGLLSANAENIVMSTPPNFQVLSMSPNGKWACGVYLDSSGLIYGFRWNLEGGSITILGGETNMAYDVANDGTVSGDFLDNKYNAKGIPVNLPGYWRDGLWHHMQMPDGNITDGIGYGISPDGKFMTGSLERDGKYTSYIWQEGEIYRSLETDNHNVSYAVSPDGSAAAGFNTQRNRTACIWTSDNQLIHFEDTDIMSQSPWSYSRNFSPDGSKLVYWGGWELDDEGNQYLYCMYDVATGERSKVKVYGMESTLEFYDISNNAMMVGTEDDRGYVYANGQGMYVDEYLASRNVDLTTYENFYNGDDYYEGVLPITSMVAVSEDENVFAMLYYDFIGRQRSLVVKIDQDETAVLPAEVAASQLSGINSVKLTWSKPMSATPLRGYNIYRDGKKLNGFLPVNMPYYYDTNVGEGTYIYQVSAVTVAGAENKSQPIEVNVTARTNEAPYGISVRQKGVNNALLTWNSPMSNIVHKNMLYSIDDEIKPFYIYAALDVEMAVSYTREEMSSYAGHKITEISFIPAAQQEQWKVNIYTRDSEGALHTIHSQAVSQNLELNKLNTVKIQPAVEIPSGELIVSVECQTDGDNYATIGANTNVVTPGCSDLIRIADVDDDFYSVHEVSLEGGSIACNTWAIDIGLSGDDTVDNESVSYNIYTDDEFFASVTDKNIVIKGLADGTHTFAVEAVYADGSLSQAKKVKADILGAYPAVETVDIEHVDDKTVKAVWQSPEDNDRTQFKFTNADKPANGIITNTEYFMAGVEYGPSTLCTYENYTIESIGFYPMAQARYGIVIFEDNTLVYADVIDEYETDKWNTVAIDQEIAIKDGRTYLVAVECSQYNPEDKLIGLDSGASIQYVSDLYSLDGGGSWNSLTADVTSGNWLIGMTLISPDGAPIPVDGYNVVIDDKQVNESLIDASEYTYSYNETDGNAHSLRVDVSYQNLPSVVIGTRTYFYLNPAGISDALTSNVTLSKGDNYLVAEGENVQSIEIYSLSGMKVAAEKGNKVSISQLAAGVYIVSIAQANKLINAKIYITK